MNDSKLFRSSISFPLKLCRLTMIKNFLSHRALASSLLSIGILSLSACSSDDINLDSLAQETNSRVIAANSNTVSQNASTNISSGTVSNPESSQASVSNPLVSSTQFFGRNGNVYKPVSDTDASGGGNLVVLFSSSFTRQFESCNIVMADGSTRGLSCINDQPWTQIPFSCFSNGNRQTWRADFKCSSVGSVLVRCLDFNQEITFTVPSGQQGNVCSRVG